MAESHLEAPAAADEWQAPTIAPSTISEKDAEKEDITTAEPSMRGVVSDAEDSAEDSKRQQQQDVVATEEVHAENEKHGASDLHRAPTAASESGSKVQEMRTREDGTEYPTGVKLGLISLALCLSVFLMALDNSIIATAIPKITDQFHSLSDVGWYGSAYLLTTAALQLLFGKFYSFFSVKWTYLVAIAIFELGSLICGVANSSITLIIGRAVAGLGSAGIFSGALIILAHSVALEKRPMYTGFIGSMYGVASVSGPLLGGVFTDRATWRWCFLINLPIGAITILIIAFFFPSPNHHRNTEKLTWRQFVMQFDPLGTVLFMPAVICLLLALQWGGTTYAWNSGRIIALIVVFVILILAFLYVQYRQQDRATVPPRIFRKRTVWSSASFSFCVGAAFLGIIYFLPIWFQAVKGASAVSSGLMNLPMLIAVVLLSVFAGIIVTLVGYYTPFMLLGSVLMSVGFGMLTTFTPDTGRPQWIGYQVLAGAGVGMAMQQPMMAVQTVLDIRDVPTGTSAVVFLQTLGGALFVSICENVFTNKLVAYITEYVPGLNPEVVLATGATSIQSTIPAEMLEGVTLAYNNALTQTFIVPAALASASIIGALFVEWKSVKGQKIEMAAA